MLLLGDHGMTATGDHGGDSENELNAALFVYSERSIEPVMSQVQLNKSIVIYFTNFGHLSAES